jgi:hypothetical protein
MLYGANFTICSEINTKHINTVWQNLTFFIVKRVGSLHKQ